MQQGEASRQTRSGAVHTHARSITLPPRAELYVRQGHLQAAALASLQALQERSEGGDEQASAALLFCMRVLELWVSTDYLQPAPALLGDSSAAAAAASGGDEGVAEVVDLTAEEELLSDPNGQLVSLLIVRESQLAAVKPDPDAAAAGQAAPAPGEVAPATAAAPAAEWAAPATVPEAAAAAAEAAPAQRPRQQPLALHSLPASVLARIAAQLNERDRRHLATCCRLLLAASRKCSQQWWPELMLVYSDRQEALRSLTAWLRRHQPASTKLHLITRSLIMGGLPREWCRGALGCGQPAWLRLATTALHVCMACCTPASLRLCWPSHCAPCLSPLGGSAAAAAGPAC